MRRFASLLTISVALTGLAAPLTVSCAQDTRPPATAPLPTTSPVSYEARAREVMRDIQAKVYLGDTGLYAHSLKDRHSDFMWGNGVMFTALVAAARHDSANFLPAMNRFFTAMDRYWDSRAPIPGYEPSPTRGDGHDKYYDDNAWMVLTYAEAFELTHDQRYLQRAQATLAFVLSGWDEQAGGGIWWHEGHRGGSKNTCVNAPAAVACLRIADYLPPDQAKRSVDMARRLVEWTNKNLRTGDGLFADSVKVNSGTVNRTKLTYNAALMIRANLGLYRHLGDEQYLNEAKRISDAANWFIDQRTRAYRDSVKWSHLLVEADLEMYRATHDEHLMERAAANAEYEYRMWKENPPSELINVASIARTLWLMADTQSPVGRQFWNRIDERDRRQPSPPMGAE